MLFRSVVLGGLTFLLVSVAKGFVPGSIEAVDGIDDNLSVGILFLGVIPAVIAAFAEELTFRYLLFGKFKPIALKVLMFIVSSLLFGLVHYNNVDGNLVQLIPYVAMGAYFAAVYAVSKNIWFAIGTHFIYNTSISLLPVLLLAIMSLFS